MTEPDVVDIAHWNGVADPDLKATPAFAWPLRRAHQYLGNVTVSYGGVKLNIDDDYLSINNPVCAVTPPSASPTASSGPTPAPDPSVPASNRLGTC
jgi:hypothetical protein